MEDHRVPHGILLPEELWPPPEVREAPDGPGRGGAQRPPTTGMLPGGQGPDPYGPVVLLAHVADHAKRDETYVRTALAMAEQQGYPAPELKCCSVAAALANARHLEPKLIVIGDSSAPEWRGLQASLCRRMKQLVPADTAVVLLRDPQIGAVQLPDDDYPDAVATTDTPSSLLASLLYSLYWS
jgi:hypothetical protein